MKANKQDIFGLFIRSQVRLNKTQFDVCDESRLNSMNQTSVSFLTFETLFTKH